MYLELGLDMLLPEICYSLLQGDEGCTFLLVQDLLLLLSCADGCVGYLHLNQILNLSKVKLRLSSSRACHFVYTQYLPPAGMRSLGRGARPIIFISCLYYSFSDPR